MKAANLIRTLALSALCAIPAAAGNGSPGAHQVFDRQLDAVEREVIGLVETMPASKFTFMPADGAFRTTRTFGVQARHIAFCLNEVAVALLGETMLPHIDQEGPRDIRSKDEVVRYLREAFAHAHRALGTLTNDNLLDPISDPYVEGLRTTRLEAATIFLSHTWDHYGQMVEYLRMNNLAPPGHR
jgi:hypothetical protein